MRGRIFARRERERERKREDRYHRDIRVKKDRNKPWIPVSLSKMTPWIFFWACLAVTSSKFKSVADEDVCGIQATEIALPFTGPGSTSTGADIIPSTFNYDACGIDGDTNVVGVWYRVTTGTDQGGFMRATLSNQDFTARISVHVQCSECLDASSPSLFSDREVEWLAQPSVTYSILVAGRDATQTGNFDLTVALVEPTPAHTSCLGAVPITTLPFTTSATTVATVTTGFSSLECDVDSTDRGLWYQLQTTTDIIVQAVLDNKSYDGRLSLYRGTDCGNLDCLATTSAFRFITNDLEFATQAGETYYLLITGEGGNDAGTFRLNVVVSVGAVRAVAVRAGAAVEHLGSHVDLISFFSLTLTGAS